MYHWPGAPAPTLCGHLLWHFAIQQQSTAPQSGHTLLTQVTSMCSWTLPCVSSLVPSILHLSHGFQCSATLNRQPYEGRLPLTSWWRKLSNMTVGQSSLISLTHHCYDWHPGSRCGWTCNQLTSKVDEGITGSRLNSGGQFSPSVWPHNPATGFRPPSATVVTAEPFSHGTGTLQCLQKEMATYRHWSVLVARRRQCSTLSNTVPWQKWMAAYLGYTLRMKMLFHGWPVMIHDTHMRRKRLTSKLFLKCH